MPKLAFASAVLIVCGVGVAAATPMAPMRRRQSDPMTPSEIAAEQSNPRAARPVTESLPAWLYTDPAFFALERERLFRQSWQIVCHVNDIPKPGDYQAFDFLDEKVVAVRGEDGSVRSFRNVCRHRASRLADGSHGNCGHRLVCPYHAWSYALDGKLAAIPRWQEFDGYDTADLGLRPVEQEIWRGFIFIRLTPGP